MAEVVVTIKIMPKSPDVDLEAIKIKATDVIAEQKGEVGKSSIEPMAFGLKSLSLIFIRDESLGSVEDIEEKIKALEGVNSAEVTDVRRTIA
ncbi:elongation factor 1-beta [archaeon]|jgi:elongation factor 1-beta|nr:elongation factor 1-beta [archaeon]MBT4351348.1 elongation factor 1-beta [archaeon]MBT4646768.1 elongation factor 1-beta [archaeon]MBT6822061.1 elongation factor 1-beta [archaeon]MBT7391447.1 elongation factor 1-beta [archaeon]